MDTNVPDIETTPAPIPAHETVTITRDAGNNVRLSVQNMSGPIELYGLIEFAKTQVPSIKWEEAKS